MSKGQKRSGREPKKPKQNKVKVAATATTATVIQGKLSAPVREKKRW